MTSCPTTYLLSNLVSNLVSNKPLFSCPINYLRSLSSSLRLSLSLSLRLCFCLCPTNLSPGMLSLLASIHRIAYMGVCHVFVCVLMCASIHRIAYINTQTNT